MRVLLSLAGAPPPVGEPTGRSERPARMAKQQRRPEWRQGRPPGRPEGTRGAEHSEHRSALDASGGRSYLGGAGERPQRLRMSRSPKSDGSLTWSTARTQGKARQPEGRAFGGEGSRQRPPARGYRSPRVRSRPNQGLPGRPRGRG